MSMASRAVVGAFVLGGIILFGGGLFLIGDRRLLFEPQFELNTTFGRVSGLEVGTQVRLSGYDAGEVLEVRIPSRPSERFVVRMRVREDLRPLVRVDSVCGVQTDGIVGNTFIQISPGSDDARVVESGGTIEGIDPVQFSDLVAEGRETFRAMAQEFLDLSNEISAAVGPLTDTARTASALLVGVGDDVRVITQAGARVVDSAELVLSDVRGMIGDVRAGRGTIGQLLTDDGQYKRWIAVAGEAEQTVANLRLAIERARELIEGVSASDGAAQQMVQSMRDTLTDTREVMSDLSESTEALKRNFLFRGFFRDRGFFDLDAISREAYVAGALERAGRTALKIWIDASGLFERDVDGAEVLTEQGKRRLESAMADLVRYPSDSPLVVEGYADGATGETAYLVSSDRALQVRDYLVRRYRRRVTLTGTMPMSEQAIGSPLGNSWSGVALALFVRSEALGAR